MSKHRTHKFEDNIRRNVLAEQPTAPSEVVKGEVRHRLGQEALKMRRNGVPLAIVSTVIGYSRTYLHSVILAVAERRADLATKFVPPLEAWLATDAAHEPAPEPEVAFEPRVRSISFEVKSESEPTVAELKARIKALMDEGEDNDAPRRKVKAKDENDDGEGPRPVYALTPHTHYVVRDAEFVVVDHMHWLKPGAQVSFMAGGLFGPRPVRRTVLSIQGMYRSRCLSLQVGEPDRT
ncbi:hypothetical protein [Lichenibacterium ramalinae]|uniref:Uncharacterized protein n=1 Tax=Lichenibacterium ramalinae TaxID=2316527 RepID=A0A4Q2R6A3_9HYPH|nr:hypothetical protein [Lichenibacterium ramalinae]RYB01892.1 hypothetical protein D3272_23610 [Lichenibacterium ramalinae]